MFGSFEKACTAAGLQGVVAKRRFSDEELLSGLESIYVFRSKSGYSSAVPSINDFKVYRSSSGGGISYDALTRQFGRYKQFLQRYQGYHYDKISRSDLIEISKRSLRNQRSNISKRTRAEILHAFGNSCTFCGLHATALAPGQQMEIDHIIPVARGGTSERENLTVKCSDCNRGKGAAFEG